jgi:glyoxylate reductase
VRPRVHVMEPVPAPVREALEGSFDLVDGPAGTDGIVAMLTQRVDEAYLEAAGSQLRIVANYAVGVDNIDLDAAARHGVVVTNTPDVLTHATAELAIGLMLALLRRIAEGDRFVRSAEPWRFSLEFMLGGGLDGKVLGIVGPGRIGHETARLGEALGMRAVFAGRSDPLEPLLENADVVSLHCPLTPDTHHLIDDAALALMKRTAVLVNTSRGPVVDEAALVDALSQRQIAGAALDVYEFEPRVTNELLGFENVVLTPHLGSATKETRVAMGMLCVDALRAVLLEDTLPPNVVRASTP